MIADKERFGFKPVDNRKKGDPQVYVSSRVRKTLGMPRSSVYESIGNLLHEQYDIDKRVLPKMKVQYIASTAIGKVLGGFHFPLSNTIYVNTLISPIDTLTNEDVWRSTIHQSSHLADSKNRPIYSTTHLLGRQAFSGAVGALAYKHINIMPDEALLPWLQSSAIGLASRVALLEPLLPAERVAQIRVKDPGSLCHMEGLSFPILELPLEERKELLLQPKLSGAT